MNTAPSSTLRLYTLGYERSHTYLVASLFILGNIALPQLCHLIPSGGLIFLPIYFFTLVGAYKYGWKVGLLTAVASPLVNSILFGMPPAAVLPSIMLKSIVLAIVASMVASRTRKAGLAQIATVVVAYQAIGCAAEWIYTGSLFTALQDVRIGLPGIGLQIVGTWAILNHLLRK